MCPSIHQPTSRHKSLTSHAAGTSEQQRRIWCRSTAYSTTSYSLAGFRRGDRLLPVSCSTSTTVIKSTAAVYRRTYLRYVVQYTRHTDLKQYLWKNKQHTVYLPGHAMTPYFVDCRRETSLERAFPSHQLQLSITVDEDDAREPFTYRSLHNTRRTRADL